MNVKQLRAAALKSAQGIIEGAKGRAMTAGEAEQVEALHAEIKGYDEQIAAAVKASGLIQSISDLSGEEHEDNATPDAAKSLGEHFVKSAGDRLADFTAHKSGTTVSVPEFKANTDTQVTTGYSPMLVEVDKTIVPAYRQRLTIADLLGSGSISGSAIQYFVEGALEGALASVAEGGEKPQIHFADPTPVTDSLKKLAGWISLSDEMLEDLPFVVSEINGRLLYQLALIEEQQLLNGAGTGSTITGLLNRSGVQTEARGNAASGDTIADTVFRAITKVQTGSGMDADGLVIHPADYQGLRLAKDLNGQYYGGGFFSGAYGNGSVSEAPNLWGVRTVVTPAIAQGTVLVGAFGQGATVYRKGGVRVESTNSDRDDFTHNKVKIRAEERLALAARYPSAFVKTTITAAAD